HDAEADAGLEAPADHVDVARLEDPERERPAREEHRVQREQRNLIRHRARSPRSRASAAPSPRGAGIRRQAGLSATSRLFNACWSSRGSPWKLPFDIITTWSPPSSSSSSRPRSASTSQATDSLLPSAASADS